MGIDTSTSSKPAVFIGSSSSSLRIAGEVARALDPVARPRPWNRGVFGLGSATLESLMAALDKHDFAVLVLSPDDRTTSKEVEQNSPRDNVLFELGLFMGRLGRDRTFILFDKAADLKLMSDLAGITLAEYDGEWASDDLAGAIGSACHPITEAIRRLGPMERLSSDVWAASAPSRYFCRSISGGWWRRPDNARQSETGYIGVMSIEPDDMGSSVQIKASVYTKDFHLFGSWKSVLSRVVEAERRIVYYWEGWYFGAPERNFHGFGEYTFEGLLQSGMGRFWRVDQIEPQNTFATSVEIRRQSPAETDELVNVSQRRMAEILAKVDEHW